MYDPALISWLKRVSRSVPLLVFFDAEDHGWEYHLIYNGMRSAMVQVSYEIEFNMILDLQELLYLETDPLDAIDDQNLKQQVLNSQEYTVAVASQYKYSNPDEFVHFDIPSETIAELKQLLIPEIYLSGIHREQVRKVKTLLGLSELEWKSYRYLSRDDAED